MLLYISTYCVHTLNTKTIHSSLSSLKHFHQRNRFTECEAGSNEVKTSKSWIQCNCTCPCGSRAQQKEKPQQTEVSTVVDTDVKCHLSGLPTKGKDIVIRFIIEYSSLMDFGP